MTRDERYWAKVDKAGPVPAHKPELGPCWVWTAGVYQGRPEYGCFNVTHALSVKAHRYGWALAYGPVPDGLSVLHHCDNGLCVRPEHLFTGTQADNIADKMAKGRHITLCGERAPSAKLTSAQVTEIRALRGTMTSHEAGWAYGCTPRNIRNIWHRVIWKQQDLEVQP